LLLLTALFASSGPDAHADPPAPPPEYSALYTELSQKLDAFESQLDTEWDGGSGTGRFAATLSSANGNKSAGLLHPFNWARIIEQLDAYQSMGVELVKLDMEYPMLTPAFQTYLAANPPVYFPGYAYTVSDFIGTPTSFYNMLFDEIRARGFDIWVEHSTLFASYSPTPPGGYFADMRTAGVAATRARYGMERAAESELIVAELEPDYFTLVEEPQTQNDNFGYFPGPIPLYTEDLWEDFVQASAQNIATNVPGATTLLGAGSGTWDGPGYIQRFAALPELDFIDFHIYPIETPFEDFYQNALDWADDVRIVDPDKLLLIGETWLYKVSEAEIVSGLPYDDILARDVYSFWEPLDRQFHEIIYKLIHHKGFEAVAPFWANYYFAYLDYGDPELEGLGNIELLSLAGQRAIPNILSVTLNPSGAKFQEIIDRPPDADGDGTPDSQDDGDYDGDALTDKTEFNCGSPARDSLRRPERTDGPFATVDDDADLVVDEALPPAAATHDCDGDGYSGLAEDNVYTAANRRDQDPCGTSAWPSDLVSGGFPNSTDRVTITDLTSFIAPVRRLNTSPPSDPGFDIRWDIAPGAGVFSKVINISDLTSLIVVAPPMLGGALALNGPSCPWP
jgi:hypothetical protein